MKTPHSIIPQRSLKCRRISKFFNSLIVIHKCQNTHSPNKACHTTYVKMPIKLFIVSKTRVLSCTVFIGKSLIQTSTTLSRPVYGFQYFNPYFIQSKRSFLTAKACLKATNWFITTLRLILRVWSSAGIDWNRNGSESLIKNRIYFPYDLLSNETISAYQFHFP